MQLVKIAIALVAVALTPSEGADHAVNKALLSRQVANHLRGQTRARGEEGKQTSALR